MEGPAVRWLDLEKDGERESGVLDTWMHQAQVQPAWTRFPALGPSHPIRGDRAVTAGEAAKAGGRWEEGPWSPEKAVQRH